jgi:myo-inositol catabolism protein IolC
LSKLWELIDPKTKKDPWLRVLETQTRNIKLSRGVVLGLVSDRNELHNAIMNTRRRRSMLGEWTRCD